MIDYAQKIAQRIEESAEHWADFVADDGELDLDHDSLFSNSFDGEDWLYDQMRNDYRVLRALAYAAERIEELAEAHRDYMKHMVYGTAESRLRYHGLRVSDFL